MTKDEHEAFLEALDDVRARNADLFAGLTPDEVRVITGLVRAMRERQLPVAPPSRDVAIRDAFDAAEWAHENMRQGADDANIKDLATEAAWHIAHAISQMEES